ncbi:MAG: DMT family transporter [Pseudomonadota bacterium]
MSSMATTGDTSFRGVPFVIAGVLVFTLQDVIIKSISGVYPVHEVMFLRNALALIPILFLVRLEGGFGLLRTRRPWAHLLRAIGMFVSYLLFYLGIAALPLADAVTLFFIAPLLITALSVPFLGEKVGLRRWSAVAVGLLGMVIVLRPGSGLMDPAALLMVGSALAYAVVAIITRRIGKTETASAMAFYACWAYVVAGAGLGLALGDGSYASTDSHASLDFMLRAWRWPTTFDFGLLCACAVITAIGFYCLSQAYRESEASVVAPFEYIAIPLATLWGYVFWDHLPDRYVLLGMAMIIGSGLYVLRREATQSRKVAAGRGLRPKV